MDITHNSKKFISGTKEFLDSNSFIAKASFIILIIICFIILFNIGYWLLTIILAPPTSPYLFSNMRKANSQLIIKQDLQQSGAKPIYRSRNQYNGIELSWSIWFYIEDPTYNPGGSSQQQMTYRNVFVKGDSQSTSRGNAQTGKFSNSNCPGVYLKPNLPIKDSNYGNGSNNLTMDLIIIIDIFPYEDPISETTQYYQEITIPSIPIKKWVSLIIRCSAQNIVDIFINGSLIQRVKLYNIIRQNYDVVYISALGGFDGYLSSLRYYDYKIGTYEINKIINKGPNLEMDGKDMTQSFPYYLSTKWIFGEQLAI